MAYDLLLVEYIDKLRTGEIHEAFLIYLKLKMMRCPEELIEWAERNTIIKGEEHGKDKT